MAVRTTVFKALTFSILVEEFHDRDAAGHLIGYFASIYVETTSKRHLVRRSRLPGAAENLRREIERDGLRAFRRLAFI
jgi:hypothetical protein